MTARARRVGREFMKHAEAMPQSDDFHQRIRALEALAFAGIALYEIKVFEDENIVFAGDGIFYWPIPADLDQAEIVYADAGVSVPSSSGPVEVQIAHHVAGAGGAGTDILSTKISIAAGDYNATPGVVTGGAYGPVAGGGPDSDWLRIDIDAAGVGAQGLAVMVGLVPSPLGSVTVQGAKGDPGGITSFEGPWTTTTVFVEGSVVSHGGVIYVAIQDHTSDSTNEPGVGVDWEDFWMVLIEPVLFSGLEIVLNGNGYVLDTGVKGWLTVPFDCTIIEATLLADIAGSMVLDIWKDTYGNYPPTDADSITAASPPTLVGAVKTTDTTLTGWTTSLAAGDVLAFNIDSCTAITRATLSLRVSK